MTDFEKKMECLAAYIMARNDSERDAARNKYLKIHSEQFPETDTIRRDADTIIRQILLELGAPDHLLGHAYAVEAVKIGIEDARYINNMFFLMYPALASKFDATASRVERAIRHLIDVTWMRGDMDVMYRYFGNTVSEDRGRPTNAEFIARLVNVVKQQLNAQ